MRKLKVKKPTKRLTPEQRLAIAKELLHYSRIGDYYTFDTAGKLVSHLTTHQLHGYKGACRGEWVGMDSRRISNKLDKLLFQQLQSCRRRLTILEYKILEDAL